MDRASLPFLVSFNVAVSVGLVCQLGAAAPKGGEGKPAIVSMNADSSTGSGSSSGTSSEPKDSPKPAFHSPLRSVLGIGPAFYWEDTDRVQDRFVNGQRDQQSDREASVSNGILALEAWYLTPWWLKQLRVGPGLGWYNDYTLKPKGDNNNNGDNYHVGQMFELYAQAEYVLIDMLSKMDVLLGLRAGAIVVFPGNDVQDEINRYKAEEYDVWDSPRPGAFIGPHFGVEWPLNDKLSVRSDLGIQFAKIWMFNAQAEAGGSLIEVKNSLITSRTQLLLGLQFGL